MICGKITRILLCKVAMFYRCLYGGGGGGGGGGEYKLDPPIQTSLKFKSVSFAHFKCITFKLGKLNNFKALFCAVLMDTAKVVVMTTC